ncbi:MAG: hypothetical protein U0U66_10500 [Cytophagaceae bacterium]
MKTFLTTVIQVSWTTCVLFFIYMLYVIEGTVEYDLIIGLGLITIAPLIGLVLIGLTVGFCLLVGLPIRLNNKINNFWLEHIKISIVGILIALILFILSFNSYFTEWREVPVEFGTVMKEEPNLVLALSGWFVMAFSLLHLYPKVLNKLLNRI